MTWYVKSWSLNHSASPAQVQFRREIDARAGGLGADSVVTIVASSDAPALRARWTRDAAKRGYGGYPRGIVMKAAQRNVMVILLQEHLTFDLVTAMVRDFVRCLGLVHANGQVRARRAEKARGGTEAPSDQSEN